MKTEVNDLLGQKPIEFVTCLQVHLSTDGHPYFHNWGSCGKGLTSVTRVGQVSVGNTVYDIMIGGRADFRDDLLYLGYWNDGKYEG